MPTVSSKGIRAAYASQVRRKLLDQVAGGKDPTRTHRVTVGDAVEAYLAWAEKTGKRTGPDRNRWDVHMRDSLRDCLIASITPHLLTDLKKAMGIRLSPQSIRHCFGFLRRAVNHCVEVEQLDIRNSFTGRRGGAFQLPKADNASVRFLTPEEAARLLLALKGRSRQLHDMALLGLKTVSRPPWLPKRSLVTK